MAAALLGGRFTIANTATSLSAILTAGGQTGGTRKIRVLLLRAEDTNTGRITIGKSANITAAGTHADSTGYLKQGESVGIDAPTALGDTSTIFLVSANGTEVLYVMLFE